MGSKENSVQKAVKEYLEWKGYTVYRINNAGSWNEKRKQYIFHGTAGVCDLIALKRGFSALFIECKSAKGKFSEAQLEFLELINKSIGLKGMVIKSLDEICDYSYKESFIDVGSER